MTNSTLIALTMAHSHITRVLYDNLSTLSSKQIEAYRVTLSLLTEMTDPYFGDNPLPCSDDIDHSQEPTPDELAHMRLLQEILA